MASHPKYYFSVAEYTAVLKAGRAPLEYWDGEIVLMSGGTPKHARIASNVQNALAVALHGSDCQMYGEGAPVHVPALPPFRMPDASVICGAPEWITVDGIGVLVNPVVIVEVESPSSKRVDHKEKLEAYQAIPSLRDYLIVSQDAYRITHWRGSVVVVNSIRSSVQLASINCELRMADIYRGVEL